MLERRGRPAPPRPCAGGFPSLQDNLWLAGGEGEAVATALVPKLNKTRAAVEQLLFEVPAPCARAGGHARAAAMHAGARELHARAGAHACARMAAACANMAAACARMAAACARMRLHARECKHA